MRAYLSTFRMRRKMELQYRGAVLGGVICQVFFGLILIAIYRAMYAGKPQAIPLSHITSYVWLQQAFFRMLVASDPELLDKIRTGSIAYDLCRPLDLYGFYYVRIMAQKMTGSLMRAVPMLVFAFLLPEGWGLMLPASAAGFAWSLAGLFLGLLCVCALENITMGFTMRTLDSRGMQALLNLLMPYAQLLDAPIRLYTGDTPPSAAPGILLIQVIWILLLTGAGILFWRVNQKRLEIQGG